MSALYLVETRSGNHSLKVSYEDGSAKTLHSLYDPEAEARSAVDAFEFNGRGVLVVLGLGLGYHVAELARRFPGAKLVVIEGVPEIYELAREHGCGIDSEVRFITGLTPDDALRKVTEYQMERGLAPLSVFALSSAVSAFSGYYRPILETLNRTVSVKLWDRLKYSKFKTDKVKVLLIDTGYFLVREVEKALKSLDHEVLRVPPKNDPPVSPLSKGGIKEGCYGDRIISGLIEAILNFKPDFLLTMNHLGFDEDGVLTDFFKSIEMPVASWYVDSPKLIVKAFNKNVSPWLSLFLWDKSYMEDMEAMGFDSVLHLPLGTDETLFKPLAVGKHRKMLSKYNCDVGFVGNSMVVPVNEWMGKVDAGFHPIVRKAAEHIALSGNPDGDIMKGLSDIEKVRIEGLSRKDKMDFEAAVIWKATRSYRLSCLEMLKGLNVRIHGDSAWKELLGDKGFKLFPPLNYYKELPLFYNACKINFNATSRQMSEAVNQRVFDVPACGAFLLTDYQKGLEDLFDVGSEVITYKDKSEIPELAGFYFNNQAARDEVVKKARNRALKEHTYKHRLEKMIHAMKGRYA